MAGSISMIDQKTAAKSSKAAPAAAAIANGNYYPVAGTTVGWMGAKAMGDHKGNVTLKSGSLSINNGSINGGSFTMDMNSITCTDLEGEYNGKLVGHLKSPDFFDVANHAEATLKITKFGAKKGNTQPITGDLTIKGITKPVTFNATITPAGKGMAAVKSTIVVDRSLYNITYKGMADNLIKDNFEIYVDMKVSSKK